MKEKTERSDGPVEEKHRPQVSAVLWLTDRLHPRATLSG